MGTPMRLTMELEREVSPREVSPRDVSQREVSQREVSLQYFRHFVNVPA